MAFVSRARIKKDSASLVGVDHMARQTLRILRAPFFFLAYMVCSDSSSL